MGTNTRLSVTTSPTAVGYSNKDIYFCWLKGHREDHGCVRKSIIDDKRVIGILEDDEYF